ncbi:unnamed protein product, partial [marine sediment metagenome]
MQEDKQSSETEIVPVSVEAETPEMPVNVVSPDGSSWVSEAPAVEAPEPAEAPTPEIVGPEAATVEEAEAFRERAKEP